MTWLPFSSGLRRRRGRGLRSRRPGWREEPSDLAGPLATIRPGRASEPRPAPEHRRIVVLDGLELVQPVGEDPSLLLPGILRVPREIPGHVAGVVVRQLLLLDCGQALEKRWDEIVRGDPEALRAERLLGSIDQVGHVSQAARTDHEPMIVTALPKSLEPPEVPLHPRT